VDYLVLGLRLVLGSVFIAAAAGKLLNAAIATESLETFGVPRKLARPGFWLLVGTEAVVAACLLIDATAREAAIVAAALVVLFSIAALTARAAGSAPTCACFGQAHARPVDARTAARNAALIAASVVCALLPRGSHMPALLAAAAGIAAAAATVATRLRARARRVRAGAAAPHAIRSSLVRTDKPTAVVFVSEDCEPCRDLAPVIEGWTDRLRDSISIVSLDVSSLTPDAGVTATPSAIVVAADGTVDSGMARGPLAVEALIRTRARGA
jgi:uncharacterized membrane protein YphA (DoxX/SURF4 family)